MFSYNSITWNAFKYWGSNGESVVEWSVATDSQIWYLIDTALALICVRLIRQGVFNEIKSLNKNYC